MNTHIKIFPLTYYKNENGIIKNGDTWLRAYKRKEIDDEKLSKLMECYWSPSHQEWLIKYNIEEK